MGVAVRREAPMGTIRVMDGTRQVAVLPPPKSPAEGTPVWIAIDLSRSKAVYCVRWDGIEQRRLSTPLGLEHVLALVRNYPECPVTVAYEACGFGYELAWALEQE